MANRTDKEANAIHGTNPQNLVEYIIRQKIYQTTYWKESCFALTAESLIERAVELKAVGGTYGGARKPTNFMCLIAKMLQIQPAKEIIIEYIKNEDFKYVRLLGAFYMRLVGRPLEVYQYLEPLYNDYRKIRLMTLEGHYVLTHIDEVIDDMLNKDHLFDVALPRLPARFALEKSGALDPRISVLDEEFDEAAVQAEAEAAAARQQAAARELAGLELGETRDTRHREGQEGNGHGRAQEEETRRRDSPERKKERWQLSREERREQARRRSPGSRSLSRSPVRGREEHDRRDRERDRGGDRRERERDDRHDRRHDDRDYRRSDRDRDRDRGRDGDRGERRHDRRSRSRSRDRRDRDADRRRSRSRSPDRRQDRDRGRVRDKERDRSREADRHKDRDKERDKGRDKGRDNKDRGKEDGKSGKPRAPDPTDPEVIAANAQRAALGLPPLK